MASLRYKAYPYADDFNPYDTFGDKGLKEWNLSNEEMLKDFGKALYDIILLTSIEQDGLITWN